MENIVGVVVIAVLLFVVGVAINAAVIWIYTSKNSRVNKSGQREFPLMIAAIDCFAVVIVLPCGTVSGIITAQGLNHPTAFNVTLNFLFLFVMYAYVFCLIAATVDKFYAVYFPFKYRFAHKKIIKIAIGLVFGFNTILDIGMQFIFFVAITSAYVTLIKTLYVLLYVLVFVTVIVFFVLIVVKLVQNGKKLGKVTPKLTSG